MTLRGIGRNKRRSGALVLGVILALTLILAAWGMIDTMLLAIDRQFNEVAIEDATVVFSVPVGDAEVAAIAEVQGVATAEPVISVQAVVSRGAEDYTTVLEAYERGTAVHGFPDGPPTDGVLVGRYLEDLLGVAVGDPITIELPQVEATFSADIEGFVDELATMVYMEREAFGDAVVAANPEVHADTLALPTFTTVKSVFEASATTSRVIRDIEEVDGVAAVADATEIRELIEEFQAFFYVFVGLMLVFGGALAFALIFNIVSVNVAERAGEFASMRANGLTHRRVASMITGEVFLLTTIGILPGLVVGYLAAVAFMNSFSSDQFPITAEMRAATFVGAAVAMFVVAGLSLIPAIRSVKRINVGEIVRERAL